MYQSHGTMEYMANYHQNELLQEARAARLAREATATDGSQAGHRLIAAAVLIVLLIVVFAL